MDLDPSSAESLQTTTTQCINSNATFKRIVSRMGVGEMGRVRNGNHTFGVAPQAATAIMGDVIGIGST